MKVVRSTRPHSYSWTVKTCCQADQEQGWRSALTRGVAARAVAITLAALEVVSPIGPLLAPPPAQALLSSPNAKLPRNVDAALRRSIPVNNTTSKQIQDKIEDVQFLLRIPQRKPYGNMIVDVEKSLKLIAAERASMLAVVPASQQDEAAAVLDELQAKLEKMIVAINTRDPDRVSFATARTLSALSALEVLQAPGLPFNLPPKYSDLPRLTGRATVEFSIKKGSSSGEYVTKSGGGGSKTTTVKVVLDGYSAPLTAGHFAQLVQEKYYDGVVVANGEMSVVVGGKLGNLTPTPTSSLPLPLEIMQSGDFEPQYRLPLEINSGELPVLPMSVYGSLAMQRGENDGDSDPSAFFFYLFDRTSSGLGGLSFDEGNFAVFGYVTEGAEVLQQIKKGDVITSAKLISGADKLVVPQVSA